MVRPPSRFTRVEFVVQKQTQSNPFAAIDEDRPAAPVTRPVDAAAARAERSAARERYLKEAGYVVLEDGPTKTLRVNRNWVVQAAPKAGELVPKTPTPAVDDNARWLLFVGDNAPLSVFEALFLDETQTETEVVMVAKTVQYGCTTATEHQPVRSAYMITRGRVAYKLRA